MSDKTADMEREVKLGSEVRDLVSGMEGIITGSQTTLGGMMQWSVQPRSENDRATSEAWNIDPAQLAWIGEGLEARAAVREKTEVGLGDRVRDKASGFEGVIVQEGVFLNGCVFLEVVGEVPKEVKDANSKPPKMFLAASRFELVKTEEVKPKTRSSTGGPSTRALARD